MPNEKNFYNIAKKDIQTGKTAICILKAKLSTGNLIDVQIKGIIKDTDLLAKEDILKLQITEQLTQNNTIKFPENQTTTIWFDDIIAIE